MGTPKLYNSLVNENRHFINYNTDADTSDGWKISIQGKTIQDAMYLYDTLKPLLYACNTPFKVGTKKLIDRKDGQSTKLMTIYIPNGVDVKSFCELVYSKITEYKGWYDIKTPSSYTHYAGGIFYRNDRNEKGFYIPA